MHVPLLHNLFHRFDRSIGTDLKRQMKLLDDFTNAISLFQFHDVIDFRGESCTYGFDCM